MARQPKGELVVIVGFNGLPPLLDGGSSSSPLDS